MNHIKCFCFLVYELIHIWSKAVDSWLDQRFSRFLHLWNPWNSVHVSGKPCIKWLYTIITIYLFYIFTLVHVIKIIYEHHACVLYSRELVNDTRIRQVQVLPTNQWSRFHAVPISTNTYIHFKVQSPHRPSGCYNSIIQQFRARNQKQHL